MTLRQLLCTLREDQRGATAIEFALVIGPLILLLIGVVEAGRLIWVSHALDEVAISSARCIGIFAPDCADGDEFAPERAIIYIQQAAASWGVTLEADDISFASDAGCGLTTGFLRVALRFSFNSALPGLHGTQLQSEACFPSQF